MFEVNRMYRHKIWTQVAFLVEKSRLVYGYTSVRYKMKIHWYNIGACHEPWSLNIRENIEIPYGKRDEYVEMGHNEKIKDFNLEIPLEERVVARIL